jgi:hypothetical protein
VKFSSRLDVEMAVGERTTVLSDHIDADHSRSFLALAARHCSGLQRLLLPSFNAVSRHSVLLLWRS